MQRNKIRSSLISLAFLFGLMFLGCDKPANASAKELDSTKTQTQSQPATAATTVEVAKKGTKFEPPVKPSKIPAGAWMCNMGTVHYAALEKGDGKCPTCGMGLTQQESGDAHSHGEHVLLK